MRRSKPCDAGLQTNPSSSSKAVLDLRRSPWARERLLPIGAVQIIDNFWSGLIDRMCRTGVFELLDHCEKTGRIENLRRAGRTGPDGPQKVYDGRYYDDSDVYKTLEAAAWAYGITSDEELRGRIDAVIAVIEAAQGDDGYLNSYFCGPRRALRWTDFDLHELYCAGHLIQAAVADVRSSGERRLLDVASRLADHVCDTFEAAPPGARRGSASFSSGGHPEIELALAELYRETGDRRFLDLCGQFLRARGKREQDTHREAFGPEYFVDHAPLQEMERMAGHVVRALYLAAGAADYVLETGDAGFDSALQRLWTTMTTRQMHLTGGLGARWENEAFGADWELPDRAHAETCASIASIMWSVRMAAAHPHGRYHDNIELTLYNAVLAAVSADGRGYFYQNPLCDDGARRRRPWFETACCPTNMARFVATLPSLVATVSRSGVSVHQYISSRIWPRVGGWAPPGCSTADPDGAGDGLVLEIRTDYPASGRVDVAVRGGDGDFALRLRIPAWSQGASLEVNGSRAKVRVVDGYAELHRRWRAGDVVSLDLPLEPGLVGSQGAPSLWGRAAVARGPVVYCAEATDNPGIDPRRVSLAAGAPGPAPVLRPASLPYSEAAAAPFPSPGIEAAALLHPEPLPGDELYQRGGPVVPPEGRPITLRMVPYAMWANRAPGPMAVWFHCADTGPGPQGTDTAASAPRDRGAVR